MSALPPKADIGTQPCNVRFVPKADSCTATNYAQWPPDARFTPKSGCSPERESVGVNSRIQELNCERVVTYHIVLSDKLIQTLAVDDALTVRVGVGAVIRARRISVNCHAKSYWFPVRAGTQDEMQIASVKPIHNTATHSIEDRILTCDRPIAR